MKTTQREKVLEHLEKYGSITSIEAIALYGATRLSDIIYRLRNSGHTIITENKTTLNRFGNVTNYAKYILK